MTALKAIRPASFPWFDYSRYTFSLGLERDGQVWLSGHSASEYDAEAQRIVVKGGMEQQTRTAYSKIAAILEAAGLQLADAQRIVEYVTTAGIDHYAEAAAVRDELFKGVAPAPAVNTVVVERLLRPQAWIEIEVAAGPRDGAAVTPKHGAGADGTVHLPTIEPVDSDGNVVAPGDLLAQTRFVFEEAGRQLESLGLNLSNVVKTVDYTTPATRGEYPRTGRIRKELLGPVYPGSAGILMSRLHHDGALIAVDVTASRHPGEAVNPGWSRYETLSYNPAVKAGGVLFMSGQAALDPATGEAVHEGDVVAQAEYTFNNIVAVLRAGGLGPEHLVQTIEYVTPEGLDRYRDVAKVRQGILTEPYPSSTGLVCAALLRPEFQIEIDPLAIFP